MELDEVPFQKDLDDPTLSPVERDIIEQLKTVYDPEIPVDIYELGLIYDIKYDKRTGEANIHMTLTAPGCPVAGVMPDWVKEAVEKVDGVENCAVHMEWDPPWRMEMMSLRAKIELNMI
ncbi:iron-sulfur cluster assembly protein [Suttonella ornithocola]|uniref:FeS assembly SUF system protein n=1 Tax=Suttonella ornithocola TaxID=279832 RepID=A0A380MWM8_9GAMM|nr:iron-sulfur cluster assembly protein [Suttonella ornithocola]SUO96313.1 FeS assembly SUF system protein [Suttonella ornithocola]